MERRRRALGLKRTTPEGSNVKSSIQVSSTKEISTENSEGHKLQRCQPTGSVTPKQKTVISRTSVTPLKAESPGSPLQSPSSQMIFPVTLASPEIEVSWDWSCSQVPNEMLPPKRTRRLQDTKAQKPVLPTITLRPRQRPPLQQPISEEENQQRLEFYKKILSSKSTESSSKTIDDSTNNNVEDATKLDSTPKRPTTRLSSSLKKRNDDSSLLDDSANEFMIACSQAIEEKLKSGEIDMGPIVDIKISQAKRHHSPGTDCTNSYKKTCHGRVNLFPDSSKCENEQSKDKIGSKNQRDTNFVLKRPEQNCFQKGKSDSSLFISELESKHSVNKTQSNFNYLPNFKSETNINNNNTLKRHNSLQNSLNPNNHSIERRPLTAKPVQPSSCQAGKNQIKPSQNKCTQNPFSKDNQSLAKPQNCSTMMNQSGKRQEHCIPSCDKNIIRPALNCSNQDKSKTSDLTSLLEDDFDMELSSLDVDSLCLKSEHNKSDSKSMTTTHAPKVCSRQEIEAKRQAALQKLMMKKKKL